MKVSFIEFYYYFYFTLFNQICIHKIDKLQEINVCLFQISATHL